MNDEEQDKAHIGRRSSKVKSWSQSQEDTNPTLYRKSQQRKVQFNSGKVSKDLEKIAKTALNKTLTWPL